MNDEAPIWMFVQSELHPGTEGIFDQYVVHARVLMAEHGVETLAVGDGIESEYTTHVWPRNGVLKYPSYAAMERFLGDPRYQAIASEYRDKAYKRVQTAVFTPVARPGARDVATEAFGHFSHGLGTGEWDGFLAMVTDDFEFRFPKGKFAGLNRGKDRAREFFAFVSQVFPDGLTVHLEHITGGDNTFLFEFRDEGTMRGEPYENRVVVALDVRGDKISGYREYFGMA